MVRRLRVNLRILYPTTPVMSSACANPLIPTLGTIALTRSNGASCYSYCASRASVYGDTGNKSRSLCLASDWNGSNVPGLASRRPRCQTAHIGSLFE
jgi:hypothetical protein